MNTQSILREYLRQSGIVTHFGPEEEMLKEAKKAPGPEDDKIVERLEKNIRTNTKLVIVMYCALGALLIFCMVLVEQFRNQPNVITRLFGGSIFSILAIVFAMRRIWLDKIQSENILSILPELSKEQKLKVIMAYLNKDLKTALKTALAGIHK